MAAYIDIEIDKLTNSIQNRVSGESFATEVTSIDLKESRQIKKKDWVFDWQKEFSFVDREIFKLTIRGDSSVYQGLMSMENKSGHIFIHLIENASVNKGKMKKFVGIPANLIAFACKISFEKGYDGFVSFIAKTKLVEHYKATLGAEVLLGDRMVIQTKSARKLIELYYDEK